MTHLKTMKQKIMSFRKDESGLAMLEAALLAPLAITLIFGVYDLGNGILMNQKTISAGHIAADLLARKPAVDSIDVADAIEAAKLAIDPYSREDFGIDIVSVEFIDDETPAAIWRVTENMNENAAAVPNSVGLGKEGEGVIVVTATYSYKPFFFQTFFSEIQMKEVSYLRGRKTSVIRHEDMI